MDDPEFLEMGVKCSKLPPVEMNSLDRGLVLCVALCLKLCEGYEGL